MSKRKTTLSSILLLFIFFLSISSIEQESEPKVVSSVRWGLVGDINQFVVDETEILVGEWLEYLVYQNSELEHVYIKEVNMKSEYLDSVIIEMIRNSIFKALNLPDKKVLADLNLDYLFFSKNPKGLLHFGGLRGKILLPIDSIMLTTNDELVYKDLTKPIVGETYEQAVKFCSWRSRIDSVRKLENEKLNLPRSIQKEYYNFSLPSIEQYQIYTTDLDSINENGYSNFNYRGSKFKKKKYPYSECGRSSVTPWHKVFRNVGGFKADYKYWGLKHVQGNVSEMTNIKGTAMGGSYFHYAILSYSDTTQSYDSPEKWLGFRTIGEPIKANRIFDN